MNVSKAPEATPVSELPYKTDLLAKQMAEFIGKGLVDPKSLDDSIRRMVNAHDMLQNISDNQVKAQPFMENVASQTVTLLEQNDETLDQRDHFDSDEDLLAHRSALSIKKAILQIEKQQPENSQELRQYVLQTIQTVAGDKKLSADFVYKMALELNATVEEYGQQRAELF